MTSLRPLEFHAVAPTLWANMFFIHTMGRRSRQVSANTLEELGDVVAKAIKSQANDALVVSVGLTDQAVMPYVWIRRNLETDEWEGELGDCIKLGIPERSIIEHDPIQMMGLNEAISKGFASVMDDGPVRVVSIPSEPIKPRKTKKLTNEEKLVESKRMVDELFDSLREEE